MYDINAYPLKSKRELDLVLTARDYMNRIGSLFGIMLLSLFCLSSICAISTAIDYYPGQQYEFSTPDSGEIPDVWTYSWTAVPSLDSVFAPDNAAKVTWTAPNVDVPTDIIISVVVSDKTFPESCNSEDHITIRVNPLAKINVIKDSVPDDSQDFGFTGSGTIGSFILDDDGGSDSTYLNSKTFNLLPGTYSVTEHVENGWTLTAVSCTDSGGNDVPVALSITLPAHGVVDVTATIDAQYVTSGSSLRIVFENTKEDFEKRN